MLFTILGITNLDLILSKKYLLPYGKPEDYVKILFRYYSDVLEEETVETMWATIVDQEKGYYKIDNIPFYGSPVASDDIVFAEFDEVEQMLTYRE